MERIESVDHLKEVVRVGATFSVGWQHIHKVVKVDKTGFEWVCVTGDCGVNEKEKIVYQILEQEVFNEEPGLYLEV